MYYDRVYFDNVLRKGIVWLNVLRQGIVRDNVLRYGMAPSNVEDGGVHNGRGPLPMWGLQWV